MVYSLLLCLGGMFRLKVMEVDDISRQSQPQGQHTGRTPLPPGVEIEAIGGASRLGREELPRPACREDGWQWVALPAPRSRSLSITMLRGASHIERPPPHDGHGKFRLRLGLDLGLLVVVMAIGHHGPTRSRPRHGSGKSSFVVFTMVMVIKPLRRSTTLPCRNLQLQLVLVVLRRVGPSQESRRGIRTTTTTTNGGCLTGLAMSRH